MKRQFVQVCKSDCNKEPFDAEAKKHKYTFCCEKGFLKSLEEFQQATEQPKEETNNEPTTLLNE